MKFEIRADENIDNPFITAYYDNNIFKNNNSITGHLWSTSRPHGALLGPPLHPVRQRRCYVTTFHLMWWNSVEKRRRWLREPLPGTRKLSAKLPNSVFRVCTVLCWRQSSCCSDISKNVWGVSPWCGQNCAVICRCKMREGALLLTSSLVLFYLLSFSQAARQGQDMKCGGMCAPALLFNLHKCTGQTWCASPLCSTQPAGLW